MIMMIMMGNTASSKVKLRGQFTIFSEKINDDDDNDDIK